MPVRTPSAPGMLHRREERLRRLFVDREVPAVTHPCPGSPHLVQHGRVLSVDEPDRASGDPLAAPVPA